IAPARDGGGPARPPFSFSSPGFCRILMHARPRSTRTRMSSLFRLPKPKPRTLERDSFDFTLGDGRSIRINRVRDPRARRLRLSVDDRGARLTLPPRASLVSGERFVREHGDWLAQQLAVQDGDDGIEPLQRGVTARLP